jgi:NADH-quinone oxidoreductase subunit L
MKAMIMNRIGDMALFLGLFTIYMVFNTLDYNSIFSMAHKMSEETIII